MSQSTNVLSTLPLTDVGVRRSPKEPYLRPILPIVFYQGRRRWRHATEFADLFAPSVREWPWVP